MLDFTNIHFPDFDTVAEREKKHYHQLHLPRIPISFPMKQNLLSSSSNNHNRPKFITLKSVQHHPISTIQVEEQVNKADMDHFYKISHNDDPLSKVSQEEVQHNQSKVLMETMRSQQTQMPMTSKINTRMTHSKQKNHPLEKQTAENSLNINQHQDYGERALYDSMEMKSPQTKSKIQESNQHNEMNEIIKQKRMTTIIFKNIVSNNPSRISNKINITHNQYIRPNQNTVNPIISTQAMSLIPSHTPINNMINMGNTIPTITNPTIKRKGINQTFMTHKRITSQTNNKEHQMLNLSPFINRDNIQHQVTELAVTQLSSKAIQNQFRAIRMWGKNIGEMEMETTETETQTPMSSNSNQSNFNSRICQNSLRRELKSCVMTEWCSDFSPCVSTPSLFDSDEDTDVLYLTR